MAGKIYIIEDHLGIGFNACNMLGRDYQIHLNRGVDPKRYRNWQYNPILMNSDLLIIEDFRTNSPDLYGPRNNYTFGLELSSEIRKAGYKGKILIATRSLQEFPDVNRVLSSTIRDINEEQDCVKKAIEDGIVNAQVPSYFFDYHTLHPVSINHIVDALISEDQRLAEEAAKAKAAAEESEKKSWRKRQADFLPKYLGDWDIAEHIRRAASNEMPWPEKLRINYKALKMRERLEAEAQAILPQVLEKLLEAKPDLLPSDDKIYIAFAAAMDQHWEKLQKEAAEATGRDWDEQRKRPKPPTETQIQEALAEEKKGKGEKTAKLPGSDYIPVIPDEPHHGGNRYEPLGNDELLRRFETADKYTDLLHPDYGHKGLKKRTQEIISEHANGGSVGQIWQRYVDDREELLEELKRRKDTKKNKKSPKSNQL